MASSAPARGMRDFLPADVRRRTYAIGVIRGVYERYGFEPLETPAVENIETLLGKYGDEGNQLIFKILKRGEHEASGQADLALRYDLTVPLSRVVAEHRSTLPKFFKRYQIQPVWRADRPARGRFREFFQCDVDAMGSTSPVVEAELCAAACEAMQALGFGDAVLRLNHRAVLGGVLEVAGVPTDRHGDALVALDKLDKIGLDGVKVEYEKRGLSPAVADTVLGILGSAAVSGAVAADNAVALDRVEAFVAGHEKAVAGIANIREVLALAARTPAAAQLRVDLSLARGLSYYTGCIMEMTVPDLAGSLGGGGRYDDLVGMFLGQQVPAAGFSLGLERILVVMGERAMFPAHITATAADVLIAQWNAATAGDALALAHELRAGHLRVEVYPDADKLGKQFKYAASTGVPLVVIEGDDERAASELTVKDLRTGDQQRLPRANAANRLREMLG
ncbi:histidine--tRNA ligase [Luteitalea pratensis]|nr:histidine--tRNA ligase [Luteitalea pratensis]